MFPLLKLPRLAQLNVLSVMAPYELYYFTLFVPKFRAMAKTIRHAEDDGSIFYDDEYCTLGLQCKKTKHFRPIIKLECRDDQASCVQTINGYSLDCRIDPGYNEGDDCRYLFIRCLLKDYETLSKILWNHLFDIIPLLSPQIHVVSTHDAFPLIPPTRPVKSLYLGDPLERDDELNISAEAFEKFFDTHAVSGFVCCKFKIEADLRVDSRVLNVDTIILQRAHNITLRSVLNFRGTNIILSYTNFEPSDIIIIIKSWQQGTHLQNLSLLIFGGNSNRISRDLVLSEIDAHEWNPSERAPGFYSKTMRPLYPVDSFDPFDCANSWDIRRESDGMLASLNFSDRSYFSLFVWRERFPTEP